MLFLYKRRAKSGLAYLGGSLRVKGENARNGARPATSTKHDFDDDLNF